MSEIMHIIDNKKVMMTDDEWSMYESICKAYDEPPMQHGKDFFVGLFESDANGMITYLRPPTRMCSFEVFLFMMSLMLHQHLRDCYKQINGIKTNADAHIATLEQKVNAKIAELDKVIAAHK